LGQAEAKAGSKVISMSDVSMTTSDVLQHMREGATLHRGFGDQIELRLTDGRNVAVPARMFDALIDEHKIKSETGNPSGFYHLV
jgi:hypothetical protein